MSTGSISFFGGRTFARWCWWCNGGPAPAFRSGIFAHPIAADCVDRAIGAVEMTAQGQSPGLPFGGEEAGLGVARPALSRPRAYEHADPGRNVVTIQLIGGREDPDRAASPAAIRRTSGVRLFGLPGRASGTCGPSTRQESGILTLHSGFTSGGQRTPFRWNRNRLPVSRKAGSSSRGGSSWDTRRGPMPGHRHSLLASVSEPPQVIVRASRRPGAPSR